MFLRMLISLFLCFLVGSSEIFFYVPVFSNSSTFSLYSILSMNTKDTPLSMVSITLLLSSFSSFRAWYSFLDMLGNGLEVHALFKAFFTSTLISSASPLFNLEQACSTVTTYSLTGGCLGLMENFGPQASSLSWSSVSGVDERFLTYFLVSLSSVLVLPISLFI